MAASVTDEAQKVYVVMLDKLKTYQAYPVGWDGEEEESRLNLMGMWI